MKAHPFQQHGLQLLVQLFKAIQCLVKSNNKPFSLSYCIPKAMLNNGSRFSCLFLMLVRKTDIFLWLTWHPSFRTHLQQRQISFSEMVLYWFSENKTTCCPCFTFIIPLCSIWEYLHCGFVIHSFSLQSSKWLTTQQCSRNGNIRFKEQVLIKLLYRKVWFLYSLTCLCEFKPISVFWFFIQENYYSLALNLSILGLIVWMKCRHVSMCHIKFNLLDTSIFLWIGFYAPVPPLIWKSQKLWVIITL